MCFQAGSVSKTLLTISTRIRFFLGMNTHVSAQVPFSCKASLTKTAMIVFFPLRFYLFVYTTNVYCQAGVSCEVFLAIVTPMWCHSSVLLYSCRRHGRFAYSIRSLVSPSWMSFQTIHCVEIYVTVNARERIVFIHDSHLGRRVSNVNLKVSHLQRWSVGSTCICGRSRSLFQWMKAIALRDICKIKSENN